MIEITKEADQHLCSILEKEGAHGVLLSVKGGGCAGFSYDWQLVTEPYGEAIPLSNGTLYIDPMAMLYVAGTVLNFDKETVSVVSGDQAGIVLAKGTMSIIGVTDDFF